MPRAKSRLTKPTSVFIKIQNQFVAADLKFNLRFLLLHHKIIMNFYEQILTTTKSQEEKKLFVEGKFN